MEKNLEKGWGTSLCGNFLPTNIRLFLDSLSPESWMESWMEAWMETVN